MGRFVYHVAQHPSVYTLGNETDTICGDLPFLCSKQQGVVNTVKTLLGDKRSLGWDP